MIIQIDHTIQLELLAPQHAESIFQLINRNRSFLRTWLMFIEQTQTTSDVLAHCEQSNRLFKEGLEYAFVIRYNNELVGRINLDKVDPQNNTANISYWLAEVYQGQGIMLKACKALIAFAFEELQLNRLEIRCSSRNLRSLALPKKLFFTHEGTMRQSKRLNNQWEDNHLYSLLRNDYEHRKLIKQQDV